MLRNQISDMSIGLRLFASLSILQIYYSPEENNLKNGLSKVTLCKVTLDLVNLRLNLVLKTCLTDCNQEIEFL